MKYCSKCGAKLEMQYLFCTECGNKINDSEHLKSTKVLDKNDDFKVDTSEDVFDGEGTLKNVNEESDKTLNINGDIVVDNLKDVINQNGTSKKNNEDSWFFKNIILVVSFIIIIVLIGTLPFLNSPKLKGSSTYFIEQYKVFNDPGIVYRLGFEPNISITGLPNTTIPGRYVVKYNYKNVFGFDAKPIERVVSVIEVSPVERLYNLSLLLSSESDILNLRCSGSTCSGKEYYRITDLDFRFENIGSIIYVSTDFDIPLQTNVRIYFKEGYFTIYTCSDTQCGTMEFDYVNRLVKQRSGPFTTFDLYWMNNYFREFGDFMFSLIDSDLLEVYEYYNN